MYLESCFGTKRNAVYVGKLRDVAGNFILSSCPLTLFKKAGEEENRLIGDFLSQVFKSLTFVASVDCAINMPLSLDKVDQVVSIIHVY